ncbi:MAG: type II toxin-antitoxin system VapC family toxin, partial [Thermofilaceae archaeon]
MRVFVDANLLVYLNVGLPAEEAELLHSFWAQLLKSHDLYTNVLVLDETLYVSRRRYGVPYEATIEFIDRAVIPFVELLPLGLEEYAAARRYIEV